MPLYHPPRHAHPKSVINYIASHPLAQDGTQFPLHHTHHKTKQSKSAPKTPISQNTFTAKPMCVRTFWKHTCVRCRKLFATVTFECDGNPSSHENGDYKNSAPVVRKGRKDCECGSCDEVALAKVQAEMEEMITSFQGARLDGDPMDIDSPTSGGEDTMDFEHTVTHHVCVCALVGKPWWACKCMYMRPGVPYPSRGR